jgi:hypothetical protein
VANLPGRNVSSVTKPGFITSAIFAELLFEIVMPFI